MAVKVIRKIDRKNRFVSLFNPNTGEYARTGVLDTCISDKDMVRMPFVELLKHEGEDPFMASFPELIDIGIMGSKCVCAEKCNVDCYQKAIDRVDGKNMSLENYEKVLKQCKNKVFTFALGGSGDVDTHENFEEILRLTREYGIVPNFTTSGIAMTKEKADICKKYCGAVAVSEHFSDYTDKALDMLIEAGVSTNIHYVLGNNTIDEAIRRLKNNDFKKGIKNVVFLLYKNCGLGRKENVLNVNDPRVKEFYELIDTGEFDFGIGLDSCQIPAVINFSHGIDRASIDTCEAGRWSCYLTADMKLLPCSFDNQDLKYAVDINECTIQEAWDGEVFEGFRNHFRKSCVNCKDRCECRGGCPLLRNIVLCNREEKDLQ